MAKKSEEEPVPQMDAAESFVIVTKARALYSRIAELEKELDMHQERAKDAKKRIEAFQSEIHALVTAKPSPQMEIVPPAEGA